MIQSLTSHHPVSRKKRILNGLMASPHFLAKKAFNFALTNLELQLQKLRLMGYPYYLSINSGNICQLSCPLCPTGMRMPGRSKGHMSLRSYERLIDEIGDCMIMARFSGWGEPLLNGNMSDMVRYAKRKAVYTQLSSNLNFPVPDVRQGLSARDMLSELVASGLDEITVAIDGVSQDTYGRYRRGGDLNTVLDDARIIVEEKRRQKRISPYLVWQFIVFKYNQNEMSKASELAKELGFDAIDFIPAHSTMGMMPFSDIHDDVKRNEDYLPDSDSDYSVYSQDGELKNPTRTCSWLWTSATINWNGSVSPCCDIYPERYDFGNCFDSSFMAIWNGETYVEARKAVREAVKGRSGIVKKGSADSVVCEKCATLRHYIEGFGV